MKRVLDGRLREDGGGLGDSPANDFDVFCPRPPRVTYCGDGAALASTVFLCFRFGELGVSGVAPACCSLLMSVVVMRPEA